MKLFLASFDIDMSIGNRNKPTLLFTMSEADIRNFVIKKSRTISGPACLIFSRNLIKHGSLSSSAQHQKN
jgi:hypothetical protein